MGSPTVDLPEGFELDEPNAMRRGLESAGHGAVSALRQGPFRHLVSPGIPPEYVGNAMADLYGRIKEAVSDPRIPSQMEDQELGRRAMLAPEVMMPAFGRAAGGVLELGAAGGRAVQISKILNQPEIQSLIKAGKAAGRTDAEIAEMLNSHFRLEDGTIRAQAISGASQKAAWSPEMVNRLRALDQEFAGTKNQNKTIISNFREAHPEYQGSDASILKTMYRTRNWGGANEATGAPQAAGARALDEGGTELGAMGGKPRQPAQITAIRDAMAGNPEFEELASKIFNKLEKIHQAEVGPAHTTFSQSSPRREDVINGVKLTYPTSPERLQEIADHAAAWQLYNKQVGGRDFELGAMGGRPAARLAPHLTQEQLQEMRQLMQRHPDHIDEIRASYGVAPEEAAGPAISITKDKGAQPQRLAPDTLPQSPPAKSAASVDRALSEDMIAEARKRIEGGESIRSVAEDFGVHNSTLQDRLVRPYSERPPGRPRSSPLSNEDVQQLILTMKRSGETDATIASEIGKLMPDETITTNMVTSQIYRLRNRGGGDFEIGAMGGKPADAPRVITADHVRDMVRELGLEASEKTTGSGTKYFKVRDPQVDASSVGVRVPAEDTPHGGARRAWQFDTSIEGTVNPHPGQLNIAGEPYAGNPDALRERLAYTFGKQTREPAPSTALTETAGPSSDQLKLLAGGIPVPDVGGWKTEVQEGQEGDPGRFANPNLTPSQDAELLDASGALRRKMRANAKDAGAEIRGMGGLPPGFVLDEPNAMSPR